MIEIPESVAYAILIIGFALGILFVSWYSVSEIRKMQVLEHQREGKLYVLNQIRWLQFGAVALLVGGFIWVAISNFRSIG
jgi:hypothetical protein